MIRKTLFWLHLAAGVVAGLAILLMCITGVSLAFEKQINAWLEPPPYSITPPADSSAHLPIEELLTKFKEQNDANPSAITMRPGRAQAMEISAGRSGSFYVNPYTGEVLGKMPALGPGQPITGVRAFFATMENWHRWLARTGESRAWGKSINDAGNLLFFGIVFSGIFLWWPRQTKWAYFKVNLFFRPRLSGKARDWNWHHVFGIWAWLPLMLIVGSGVIMSYPWANNLLYTMTGSPLPPQPGALKGAPGKGGPAKGGPKGAPGEAKGGPAPGGFGPPGFGQPANWTGLGLAWPKAEQQVADWQTIRVQGSPNENAPFSFSIDRGDGTQPQLRGTLTVGRDGVVQKWADFSASSTGAQLRILARYAHTGEVIGVSGQWIAALATAAAAVMVYTGLALALRRFLGWRRRPAS